MGWWVAGWYWVVTMNGRRANGVQHVFEFPTVPSPHTPHHANHHPHSDPLHSLSLSSFFSFVHACDGICATAPYSPSIPQHNRQHLMAFCPRVTISRSAISWYLFLVFSACESRANQALSPVTAGTLTSLSFSHPPRFIPGDDDGWKSLLLIVYLRLIY